MVAASREKSFRSASKTRKCGVVETEDLRVSDLVTRQGRAALCIQRGQRAQVLMNPGVAQAILLLRHQRKSFQVDRPCQIECEAGPLLVATQTVRLVQQRPGRFAH